MVVVVIVGVLAATSIPLFMRTRLNTNEVVAQHDLKSVSAAVEIFRTSQIPPRYPNNLAELATESIPTLDAAITVGGMQHGYNFKLISSADGSSYSCVANPVQFGATGSKSFCIDHSAGLRKYSDTIDADEAGCPNTKTLLSVEA